MSYQRCTTLEPFNRSRKKLRVFLVDRARPDRTAVRQRFEHTRDVPIQFISSTLALSPHGEMDGRINGCTWSVRFSRASEERCVKDSRSLFLNLFGCAGRSRIREIFFCFFLFRLSFLSFVPLSLLPSPLCAIVPNERSLQALEKISLRSLEIYFHLRGISPTNRTSRIEGTKLRTLASVFESHMRNSSQSVSVLGV